MSAQIDMENSENLIDYQIDTNAKEAYFIRITISFRSRVQNPSLCIPAWRPGRYMIQNYAAQVRDWQAMDQFGNAFAVTKKDRLTWKINVEKDTLIQFTYLYYCRQMDAGGCWSDPSLFYINPVACLMYVQDQTETACGVSFHLPPTFKIATGLAFKGNNNYTATSFLQLSDCPVMASPNLLTLEYTVHGIPFYIHSIVDKSYLPESISSDFALFTQTQIDQFGSFPEKEYHFLLLILPYTHYHGVEHRNSTVICLGPAAEVKKDLYTELLGICSHELLHAWNICKIRPEEMLPYDFSKENYFKTGFVAEGFTTYLGDHYLTKSGVLPIKWYENELNTLLKRHFYSFGNQHLSIADSSMDLWVDGYEAGIPNRKVSIYVKGAIIAFLMDTFIRMASSNEKNLMFLLKELYEHYTITGKGYSEDQIERLFHSFTNYKYMKAYQKWIYETGDLKADLVQAFTYLGYEIQEVAHASFFPGKIGLLCDANYIVLSVDPSSPYAATISKGDKILAVNHIKIKEYSEEALQLLKECTLKISNGVIEWEERIRINEKFYFNTLQIIIPADTAFI